ncbi:agmatinase [Metallosphaera hakonensis]|uniref:Agmatinase n=1 Tax=Metallosphaera hakonensis JCM 8857 = DSM 7519 TaxID=1293036 RepID=A0A2U9IU53_9CREN|nr:agmatinase [Metallosphaera hakonensis]AWR99554.1 agmatinase [Metallosphaera hakonensis JCM 8857 = DSM 7519]
MSDPRLLYLNETPQKFGLFKSKSPFAIVGIPMDITSSFRPGSRFAPQKIRHVSQFIEFLSIRSGVDMSEVGFVDFGDIILHPSDVEENVERISQVISYISELNKVVISIGGEHTITVGTVLGIKADCVLSFDAHLDLRDEYMGYRYDHACVQRRLSEKGVKIMEIGNRAMGRDEIEYAKASGIPFITSHEVKTLGVREVAMRVVNFLKPCNRIYITYDMDAIDPSYAPGVATPEPEGLDPSTVLDIMNLVADKRVVGFDVVEVSPSYDPTEITSVLGAKLILETAAKIKTKLL